MTEAVREPTRVVLVDDHALMREGIRTILSVQDDLEVVGQAGSGEEALAVVRSTRPDIVLDVEMPGMGGIEATRLLTADPEVTARVLVLYHVRPEDYLIAALHASASGFLLKNSRPEQLADSIVRSPPARPCSRPR
ncbi:MAG: response regulator transcription factor [Micropruina sp.]